MVFVRPFLNFFCGFRILRSRSFCKCAILLSFIILQSDYRLLNFTKPHFSNVRGSSTKSSDTFRRVEIDDITEIINVVENICVHTTSNHHHISNTAFQKILEHDFDILFIIFLKEAAFAYIHQFGNIIGHIVCNSIIRCAEYCIFQC
ncbi:MAG: hypothetical protein PHV32_19650 [Eubacteriales bacterium]|nr:hypothetical protein [Eubacteriales bacterium]